MLKFKKIVATAKTECPLCEHDSPELLSRSITRNVPGSVSNISICKNCGFVFMNPRWTPEQYNQVMDYWYPQKFTHNADSRLEATFDPAKEEIRFRKWERMYERIESFYPNGIENVLDVGAGQGWCIQFLQTKYPNIQPFAIERWPAAKTHLKDAYGAKIIADTTEDEWDPEYQGRFDLIVFRHTLEHLLDPLVALEKIRSFLSGDGMAYIAVPTLKHIKVPLEHDFFRPVHVLYFQKETLEALCQRAGLEAVICEDDRGDAWGLFKRGEKKNVVPDLYEANRRALTDLKRKERWSALRARASITLHSWLRRLGIED